MKLHFYPMHYIVIYSMVHHTFQYQSRAGMCQPKKVWSDVVTEIKANLVLWIPTMMSINSQMP